MDLGTILLGGGGGLAVLLTLLQISKIQINPWSAIAKVIGNALNADVRSQLTGMQNQLTALENDNKRQDNERLEDKAITARGEVIQFADEVRRGVRHSEENFNRIFDYIKFYKNYCREHPDFENDKAVTSIAIIEKVYHECMMENKFL